MRTRSQKENELAIKVVHSIQASKLPIYGQTKMESKPLSTLTPRRISKRLSKAMNKDVYEFQFDINTSECSKKNRRKKKKPIVKNKKVKQPALQSTMLTTDPNFVNPIREKKLPKKSMLVCNSSECVDSYSCDFGFDSRDMDDGYEASISVATDNDFSETNQSEYFKINPSLPLTSYKEDPPKLAGIFCGPTSTPAAIDRTVSTINKKSVKDDVKSCFGFDEPNESLSLSPVGLIKKSRDLKFIGKNKPGISNQCFSKSFKKNEKENKISDKKDFSPPEAPHRPAFITKRGLDYLRVQSRLNGDINNQSFLFTDEDEIDLMSKIEVKPSINSPLKNVANTSSLNKSISPNKSFTKPPRKSYERKSLSFTGVEASKKLLKGYPSTDSDRENEHPLKKSTSRRKALSKVKKNSKKKTLKLSPKNSTGGSSNGRKVFKKKIGNGGNILEKLIEDWASDLNSHFSEIDEFELVVE